MGGEVGQGFMTLVSEVLVEEDLTFVEDGDLAYMLLERIAVELVDDVDRSLNIVS